MKRYVLMAMLVTGLAVAGRVVAQDNDNDRKSFKEKMEELEIQNKEMDLQERQAELDFRQECRKLEIEKKRTELNKQQQMIKDANDSARRNAYGYARQATPHSWARCAWRNATRRSAHGRF